MADVSQLTQRQREIYEFIRNTVHRQGYAPAIRDIGEHFGIKSPNGVMCHLKALEKKGLIVRTPDLARAIRLKDHRTPHRDGLPYLGRVAAGKPISAQEVPDRLDLNELFGGAEHFVLKVQGQSMIDDHIDDGDFVVIRRQDTPTNGTRVVALVESEVTLKKFYRKRDHIRLEPANGSMAPIIVEPDKDVRILGVLVGVMRKC